MKVFEKIGPENTQETIEIALNKAIELGTDIVFASSTGKTALEILKVAKEKKFKNKLVMISLAYGYPNPGENRLDETLRKELENQGIHIITAAHVLSGAERGISKVYKTISPVEIMADTLRMISRGIKVCVECATMALDAGAIDYQKAVVCIGGSGAGADAACVMTPEYAHNILKAKVHEFLCMPY